MKAIGDMTVGELGAMVATHLAGKGIDVVLSGGACVMIYAEGRYVSYDLDLVQTGAAPRATLRQALGEIGFSERGRCFVHEDSRFVLDFPAPPLAVGREPPRQIETLSYETGVLRALSPTDCVKDRLANYYHFNDMPSLEQAILVARSRTVDIEELRRWSANEGMAAKFEEVADSLTS